ncbi:MAG: YhcH/YjgK/YiaL family protein [Oscillospiraceae bacterium]
MIFDKLSNAHFYYGMGKKFEDAFKFLQSTDFSSMPAGVYSTMIGGEQTPFKVKRYDSRPIGDCKFEKHENCIDLQYIVSGKEYFGYAPFGDDLVRCGDNLSDDCVYYEDTASRVTLEEGMFAMALTGDVHMPELRIGEKSVPVVKAIVKIHAK